MRNRVDESLIPIIEQNVRLNEVLQEDEIRKVFAISDDEECADIYAHYTTCKHILMEHGSKKDIEKAMRQLKSTLRKILDDNKPIDFLAIVSDGISKRQKRLFSVKNNILHNKKNNGQKRPAEINYNGAKYRVFHYKSEQVRRERKRLNRTSTISTS